MSVEIHGCAPVPSLTPSFLLFAYCIIVPHTLHTHRYFETEEWNGIPGQWWFGGGTDITPCYVVPEDMKHFHQTYKNVCDK